MKNSRPYLSEHERFVADVIDVLESVDSVSWSHNIGMGSTITDFERNHAELLDRVKTKLHIAYRAKNYTEDDAVGEVVASSEFGFSLLLKVIDSLERDVETPENAALLEKHRKNFVTSLAAYKE